MKQPVLVFISYAHLDNESEDRKERWLDRLLEHLAPLSRGGQIETWSDQQIEIGDLWDSKIKDALNNAKIIILLISPSFLASKYIANNEVPVALKKAMDKGAVIIPIIIGHCLYNDTKFNFPDPINGPEELSLSVFQAANSPNNPIDEMSTSAQNKIFLSVAKRVLKEISSQNPY